MSATAGVSNTRFELRPNCSLSKRGTTFFYCGIFALTLAIGLVFALLGLWVILPFAGLELAALGAALRLTVVRSRQREVIWVNDESVRIESRGRLRGRFPRGWAQVILERPRISWYPSRLLIRSHGLQVEVGEFLRETERRKLAGDLRHALAR